MPLRLWCCVVALALGGGACSDVPDEIIPDARIVVAPADARVRDASPPPDGNVDAGVPDAFVPDAQVSDARINDAPPP